MVSVTDRGVAETLARLELDLAEHRRIGFADPAAIARLEGRLRDLVHDVSEGGADPVAVARLEDAVLELNEPSEDRADDELEGEPAPTAACSACGVTSWAPILYGMPSFDDAGLMAAIRRGDVVAGGCSVEPGKPLWQCRRCGAGDGGL